MVPEHKAFLFCNYLHEVDNLLGQDKLSEARILIAQCFEEIKKMDRYR